MSKMGKLLEELDEAGEQTAIAALNDDEITLAHVIKYRLCLRAEDAVLAKIQKLLEGKP
jgi:hypothetical protein